MTAEFPLAVHALVYLLHKGTVISSLELAENICTNPARVRKVMTKLHKAGLVEAGRGKGSGYMAKDMSDDLTLSSVLYALEETPVEMNWHSGDDERQCLVSSGMSNIMDSIYEQMNETCIKQLSNITIGLINDQIFADKGQDTEQNAGSVLADEDMEARAGLRG